jgi:hypothetical protein
MLVPCHAACLAVAGVNTPQLKQLQSKRVRPIQRKLDVSVPAASRAPWRRVRRCAGGHRARATASASSRAASPGTAGPRSTSTWSTLAGHTIILLKARSRSCSARRLPAGAAVPSTASCSLTAEGLSLLEARPACDWCAGWGVSDETTRETT